MDFFSIMREKQHLSNYHHFPVHKFRILPRHFFPHQGKLTCSFHCCVNAPFFYYLRPFPVRSLTDPVLSNWAIRFQIMLSLKDTLTLKCCGEFSLSLNNWSFTGIVKLNEFYSLLDIIRSHFNFQGRLYDKRRKKI